MLLWVLGAIALGTGRRTLNICLVLAALGWMGATSVDLPVVSIPRVHLPVLLLLLPAMATGASAIQGLRFGRIVNLILVAVVTGQAALGAPHVLTPSNADQEETLIRAAVDALPERDGCLVTMRYGDPPEAKDTQRHFPDYLLHTHQIIGLQAFSSDPGQCPNGAIALLGTRCYMQFRLPDEAEVPVDGELEVCKDFRRRHPLEPIVEREIVNRQQLTFPMYPNRETLPVGVYRLPGAKQD